MHRHAVSQATHAIYAASIRLRALRYVMVRPLAAAGPACRNVYNENASFQWTGN